MMNALRRTVGRTALRLTLVGVVVLGLITQSSAYLLGFAQDSQQPGRLAAPYAALSHGGPGVHPVGVRRVGPDEAPVEMTVWYPATDAALTEPPMSYSYALSVIAADAPTTLSTSVGRARLGADPDRPGGPYPLVVLSAAFAISPESYAWLAEHLASHGLVVVAPRHQETLDPRALWRAAIDRPRVIAATRDHLTRAARPGGDFAGLVDPDRVAVVGHSYGGYTALAAGGARPDHEAFAAGCSEARVDDDSLVFLCDALEPRFAEVVAAADRDGPAAPVDAVVSLAGDAAPFGSAGLAHLDAPLLVVGGTADHDSPYAWTTALAYEGAMSDRKVEVALEGAEHFVFSGQCERTRRIVALVPNGFCRDDAWDRAEARTVIGHYVAAFLLAELAGSASDRAALSPERPAPPAVGYRSIGY